MRLNRQILEPTQGTPKKDVVILHGLFGYGTNWRTLAKKLSDELSEKKHLLFLNFISCRTKVRCHLLDLRNHGNSPHTKSMTYSDMSNDILEYVQTQNLSQIALIGHSLVGFWVLN